MNAKGTSQPQRVESQDGERSIYDTTANLGVLLTQLLRCQHCEEELLRPGSTDGGMMLEKTARQPVVYIQIIGPFRIHTQ